MAKKENVIVLSEVTNDQLLAELATRLGASGAAASDFSFPTPEAIDKMDLEELKSVVAKIGGTADADADEDDLKDALKAFFHIGADEVADLDKRDVKELCELLALKPTKDIDENVKLVKEYISGFDPDAAGKSDSGKGEPEKEKKEEIDPEAVAAEAELPKAKVMIKHLDAYNDAADKKARIKFDEDKEDEVEAAYRKLLALMVTSEGTIAEWEEPYINHTGSEAFCCGIALQEVKGDDTAGTCAVTETTYVFDADKGTFSEKK